MIDLCGSITDCGWSKKLALFRARTGGRLPLMVFAGTKLTEDLKRLHTKRSIIEIPSWDIIILVAIVVELIDELTIRLCLF
mmetsp:Transcript_23537/g.65332  ORF Transcript_23537/g.65332 Transcript_23537/m.65332 type:complete len:81 (-) Transcript_23537:175-417(-)